MVVTLLTDEAADVSLFFIFSIYHFSILIGTGSSPDPIQDGHWLQLERSSGRLALVSTS